MGLFGSRSFLDRDIEQWHLDHWKILIERFGGDVSLSDTPLVLPTREFFPPTEAEGHEMAEHVLACVKAAMGLDHNWPCRLEPQGTSNVGLQVAAFVAIEGESPPNGTFQLDPGVGAIITYAPELLGDPTGLVATFAHELAHYLLSSEQDLVEDETHELLTDLVVAYSGFGLFGANSSFHFEQHGDAFSQGWRSRSSGYLSPQSWAFALAVFGELRGGNDDMGRYLKPNIDDQRRKAVKYLRKNPHLLKSLRDAS